MKRINALTIFCLALMQFYACSDYSKIGDVELEERDVELAVPLINTKLTVNDLINNTDGDSNVALNIDEDGRITLVYSGDVLQKQKEEIFQAIPLAIFPITDTATVHDVPFSNDQRVDKALFGNTNYGLSMSTNVGEEVTVTFSIPECKKDGQSYSKEFVIPEGTSDFISDKISLKGWTLESADQEITLKYDARLPDGTRIELNQMVMAIDAIIFDYVEGYFGYDIFDINGDFITIGLLDTWVSGGLSFESPKVEIYVENAFGFPVRSKFNTMTVTTVTGETFDVQSNIIDENIDFDYPDLTEVGEVKSTSFQFDNTNSNLVELFEEKVTRVSYDIDAEINPDMDTSIIEFLDSSGYFLISVDVELPLNGTVNDLKLQDTLDLDLSEFDEVTSSEFKSILANDFPAEIALQAYFLDDQNTTIDSLFDNRLILPSASTDANGKSLGGEEQTEFTTFDESRFNEIKKTKRVLMQVKINTPSPTWIYSDYGILFKVGAKMKTSI